MASVKDAVAALKGHAPKAGETREAVNQVIDVYQALAADLVVLHAAITSHEDEFVAFRKLYDDYVQGGIGKEPQPTMFLGLTGRLDSVSVDIAELIQLDTRAYPLLEHIPAVAKSLVSNIQRMKADLMRPRTAAGYSSAVDFLAVFRKCVIEPLRIGIASHQSLLQQDHITPQERKIIEKPVDKALYLFPRHT